MTLVIFSLNFRVNFLKIFLSNYWSQKLDFLKQCLFIFCFHFQTNCQRFHSNYSLQKLNFFFFLQILCICMPNDKIHFLYESDFKVLLNENFRFLFLPKFLNKYSSKISQQLFMPDGWNFNTLFFLVCHMVGLILFSFFSQILYQLSVNCLVELRVALVKITVNIKPLSLKIL